MGIQVEILSVKTVTKPTAKGSYQQLEVAYKNLSFQGKVEGKNIMSFGAAANTFKTLATAATGDVYDIEIVKNDKGYNDWVSAKKSGAGVATSSDGTTPARSPSSNSTSTGTSTGRSTYETPEERAKKQVYIIRQSSLSSAIDLLSVGSKSAPKVSDVIDVAKQFEDFVFGVSTAKQDANVDSTLNISGFDDLEDVLPD